MKINESISRIKFIFPNWGGIYKSSAASSTSSQATPKKPGVAVYSATATPNGAANNNGNVKPDVGMASSFVRDVMIEATYSNNQKTAVAH